jgi:signal transduction histidine kinase
MSRGSVGYVEVWQNGTRLSAGEVRQDNGRFATLGTQGAELISPKGELFIRVEGWADLKPALNTIVVAPLATIESDIGLRRHLIETGTIVVVVICLFAGTLASFGYVMAGMDSRALWFALFTGLLAPALVSGFVITERLGHLSLRLHLTMLLVGLAAGCVSRFIALTIRAPQPITNRVQAAYVALVVLPLPFLYQQEVPFPYALWVNGMMVSLGILTLIALIRAAMRQLNVPTALLLAGCVLSLATGIQSILQGWTVAFADQPPLAQFGPVPLVAAMGAIILRRLRQQGLRTKAARRQLTRRLEARERELQNAHRDMLVLESRNAALAERARITRDMHDGLGSQLVTAIRIAERGAVDQADLVGLLRESLDELRVIIDSSRFADHCVFAMLATFEERIVRKFAAAGITVHWNVQGDARLALGRDGKLSLLRILQEIMTNVLKHAHAKTLSISGQWSGQSYRFVVRDDGIGFRTDGRDDSRLGLSNLRTRVGGLGGSLSISSSKTGTVTRFSVRPTPQAIAAE